MSDLDYEPSNFKLPFTSDDRYVGVLGHEDYDLLAETFVGRSSETLCWLALSADNDETRAVLDEMIAAELVELHDNGLYSLTNTALRILHKHYPSDSLEKDRKKLEITPTSHSIEQIMSGFDYTSEEVIVHGDSALGTYHSEINGRFEYSATLFHSSDGVEMVSFSATVSPSQNDDRELSIRVPVEHLEDELMKFLKLG